MPICPNGHTSQTTDYCDYCGTPMSGQPAPAPAQPWQPAHAPAAPTAGLPVCPICATPRTGRYCEECGYDWDLAPQGAAPQPTPNPGPPPFPGAGAYPGQPQPGQPQPDPQFAPQPFPGQGFPGQPQGQPGQPQPDPQFAPQPFPGAGAYPGQPQPGQPQPDPQFAPQPFPGAGAYPGEPASGPVSAPVSAPVPGPVTNGGGYGSYITGDTNGGNTEYVLAPPSQGGPGGMPGANPGLGGMDPFGPSSGSGGQPQQPAAPAYRGTWIAVIAADRDYFQDIMSRSGPDASGLYFPPYSPERRVPMTGQRELRIGRRSQQRGTLPEIDLSIAPEDPGVSHEHALLREQPDGSWVVEDRDSANGTTLNGSPDPIPVHTPVQLNNGDRIHVGAWTTITVHCA
ncbi:hypothetical protein ABH931_002274 [Streptacidiphilus sp. MAP12-33]|uniref:FHA domain-containing protein n=1 Tax=Streptacidiphilus sp. MAP12-33 TaxID=3156266 RepID=UPI003513AA6E